MSVTSHSIDLPEGYCIFPLFLVVPPYVPPMDLLLYNVISHPSNSPVRVFSLNQKPRWLQSAGVRGKVSSIKAEMVWDDMEYTGFKILLCCQIDLCLLMCSCNKCSRMWRRKTQETKELWGKALCPKLYLLLSSHSHFWEASRPLRPFPCDCVCACSLAVTSPFCA